MLVLIAYTRTDRQTHIQTHTHTHTPTHTHIHTHNHITPLTLVLEELDGVGAVARVEAVLAAPGGRGLLALFAGLHGRVQVSVVLLPPRQTARLALLRLPRVRARSLG